MSATPTPVIGVAGVPAVAHALREIGFDVVTGSTFREAAIAIATRLKSEPFHIVVESLHEPGFVKWVQLHHAKSLGIVLVPTDPTVELGGDIAEVPRLALPATVNDLLIRLGHSPALSPAGELVIAGAGEPVPAVSADPFAQVEHPAAPAAQPTDPFAVVEPTPAPAPAPSDPFLAMVEAVEQPAPAPTVQEPVPAAAPAQAPSDPFASIAPAEPVPAPAPAETDPLRAVIASFDSGSPAGDPFADAGAEPAVSDPFAQAAQVTDPFAAPAPAADPVPQVSDPFAQVADVAGPSPAPAAGGPFAFLGDAAPAVAEQQPTEPAPQPYDPAPQPNPAAPAAPAVFDPFAADNITGDDAFLDAISQAAPPAATPAPVEASPAQPQPQPTYQPAPARQPVYEPAPQPQPVQQPIPQPQPTLAPAPQPQQAAPQPWAAASAPRPEPYAAPHHAHAQPAPWENIRPAQTGPAHDFFANDGFSAGGCQVIFSLAGKGGAGKTTQTLMYAQTAGAAGLRTLVIDANRDQGDIGSSLRIEKAGLPTVLQSISGRPEDAVVTKAQINAVRPSASQDIEFDVVLAPPREFAGPQYATAQVYSRLLAWAKQRYQVIVVDTQIVEANKSDLHLGFIIPELRAGAWSAGIALYDYSAIRNAFAVFDELAALGVTPQRTLVVATRWPAKEADTDRFVSQFGHYGTFVGFVADDPNVNAQKSVGNLLIGSPAVAPAVKALLHRVTGNPAFAPETAAPKKRRGLFGGRK